MAVATVALLLVCSFTVAISYPTDLEIPYGYVETTSDFPVTPIATDDFLTQKLHDATSEQTTDDDDTVASTIPSASIAGTTEETADEEESTSSVLTLVLPAEMSNVLDLSNEQSKQKLQTLYEDFHHSDSLKFYASKVEKNWQDASDTCKNLGMALLSIPTQQDQLELFKFLFVNDLVPTDDFSGYWLSGKETWDGLYNWTSIGKPMGCWGWLQDEPSTVHGDERCVEIKFEAGRVRMGWNNFLCDRELKFICQPVAENGKERDEEEELESWEQAVHEMDLSCYRKYYFGHVQPVYRRSFPNTPYGDDYYSI